MSKVFCIELTVRDYELDQYGVVNNAVYLNYLELARARLLAEIGVHTHREASQGRALALSEISLKFRKPLQANDSFRISTTIGQLSGARATFRQSILLDPGGQPILEAVAVAVFLNERGKPMRIAPEIRAGFEKYLAREPTA